MLTLPSTKVQNLLGLQEQFGFARIAIIEYTTEIHISFLRSSGFLQQLLSFLIVKNPQTIRVRTLLTVGAVLTTLVWILGIVGIGSLEFASHIIHRHGHLYLSPSLLPVEQGSTYDFSP